MLTYISRDRERMGMVTYVSGAVEVEVSYWFKYIRNKHPLGIYMFHKTSSSLLLSFKTTL